MQCVLPNVHCVPVPSTRLPHHYAPFPLVTPRVYPAYYIVNTCCTAPFLLIIVRSVPNAGDAHREKGRNSDGMIAETDDIVMKAQ